MELTTTRRGWSGARIRPAAAIAAGIGLLTLLGVNVGCESGKRAAPRLVDGSSAPSLPSALEAVGDRAVVSRVRILHASELDERGQACLRAFRPEFEIPPTTLVVERTGAVGANLTYLDARRHVVLGCDRTGRPAESGGPWCARSVGRLFSGRLRDPRVDILCHGANGDPVGFGWIEPAPRARWIVSRNRSASEVEEVTAGLPVRISTSDVDVATSSATFDVTEYDADGEKVTSRRINAGVAG